MEVENGKTEIRIIKIPHTQGLGYLAGRELQDYKRIHRDASWNARKSSGVIILELAWCSWPRIVNTIK